MDKNSTEVGTGLVGAPECGDVMKLQIKVNPQTNVIEDAKFKTFGCGSAIASSSLATEWVKGKTVDEALADQEHGDREGAGAASGEDSLLGAGGRRDPGGDSRLEEEAGSRQAGSCRKRSKLSARRAAQSRAARDVGLHSYDNYNRRNRKPPARPRAVSGHRQGAGADSYRPSSRKAFRPSRAGCAWACRAAGVRA